jgi:hypothetical protein
VFRAIALLAPLRGASSKENLMNSRNQPARSLVPGVEYLFEMNPRDGVRHGYQGGGIRRAIFDARVKLGVGKHAAAFFRIVDDDGQRALIAEAAVATIVPAPIETPNRTSATGAMSPSRMGMSLVGAPPLTWQPPERETVA